MGLYLDFQVELSFHTGDVITVYGEMDDDGFYMAELRGHRGLVPSNFLTDAPHGTAGGVGGVVGGVAGGVGGAMKGLLGGVTGGMGVSGAAGPAVPPRGGVQGKKGETKITPLPLSFP